MSSSLKRLAAHELQGEEEEDEYLFHESKKRRSSFMNAVREVMKAQSMQCLFRELEPFLRRVVREEVQKGLSHYVYSASRPLFTQIQASVAPRWRLSFKSKLPDTLFTGSRIESEDNKPVKIFIEDSNSGMPVTSGLLSSLRIEIVVLDGDFCGEEQEDWTEKEFGDSVVREREGKRPLLTGDLIVTLKAGVGIFGSVTFTDNSSWIRSRKFRLGARTLPGNYTEERIQEAISGTFFVKDHRGELYKKHHPPALHDDVWRLEKIGKDGAFHKRLSENGIMTVQEFLKSLVMDQNWLRSILGSGMSNKIWEATVEHAFECDLEDKKLYSYYIAENQVMLFFNSIFQVVGAKFGVYDYQPISDLTASQMALVNRLKQDAYRNRNGIIEFDVPQVGILSRHLTIADASVSGSRSQDLQSPEFSNALKGQWYNKKQQSCHFNNGGEQITLAGLEHLFGQQPSQAKVSEDPAMPLQFFSSSFQNNPNGTDFLGRSGDYGMEPSTSRLIGSTGETFLSCGSNVGMANCFPQTVGWDLENRPFQASDSKMAHGYPTTAPGFSVHIPRSIPWSKWVKLMAALKCGMSIRRRVAAKRRARVFGYQALPDFPGTYHM